MPVDSGHISSQIHDNVLADWPYPKLELWKCNDRLGNGHIQSKTHTRTILVSAGSPTQGYITLECQLCQSHRQTNIAPANQSLDTSETQNYSIDAWTKLGQTDKHKKFQISDATINVENSKHNSSKLYFMNQRKCICLYGFRLDNRHKGSCQKHP